MGSDKLNQFRERRRNCSSAQRWHSNFSILIKINQAHSVLFLVIGHFLSVGKTSMKALLQPPYSKQHIHHECLINNGRLAVAETRNDSYFLALSLSFPFFTHTFIVSESGNMTKGERQNCNPTTVHTLWNCKNASNCFLASNQLICYGSASLAV